MLDVLTIYFILINVITKCAAYKLCFLKYDESLTPLSEVSLILTANFLMK